MIAHKNDRFLIKSDFLDNLPLFRQWVGLGGNFEHHPIFMEMKGDIRKPNTPFKFNYVWIKDDTVRSLVREQWKQFSHEGGRSIVLEKNYYQMGCGKS